MIPFLPAVSSRSDLGISGQIRGLHLAAFNYVLPLDLYTLLARRGFHLVPLGVFESLFTNVPLVLVQLNDR